MILQSLGKWGRRVFRPVFLACASALLFVSGLGAEEETAPGLDSLPEVPFASLSNVDRNPLGAEALAMHAAAWKHGESEHFIYHFIHGYVVTPISVEAEFCFRVLAEQLGPDKLTGTGPKSHIYIFEKPEDWKVFQSRAFLEQWTGGVHSHGSLFIVRDPAYKFANNSLGHEIAHLVLFRIYERTLPPWLDEGFAEYTSRVAQSSYQRARNYIAHPHSESIPAAEFIPLARLTTLTAYPPPNEVGPFYRESERLVRFLVATDRPAFLALLDSVARGESFSNALSRSYSGRFFDLEALEREFTGYAAKDLQPVATN